MTRRWLTAAALCGLVLAAVVIGLQYRAAHPGAAAADRHAADGRAAAVAADAASARPGSGAPPENGSGPSASAAAAATTLSGRRIAELGLTRQLAGEHRIRDEGRSFIVVGTKETVDQSGASATMLLIVDEISGQVRYHLPGLQFSLKPGVDAEAFIREFPRLRRLFVNPIYAQVSVDAAEIAEQFQLLQRDPRVERLRLMTREAVRKPR